ncbi:hypothetical protein D039_0769B, partial [Vibrio parahaemolyticus EKP-028]
KPAWFNTRALSAPSLSTETR